MFTLRIQWADATYPQRTVYSASKYAVGHPMKDQDPYTSIFLDDDMHDVRLGPGDRCYVMNGEGATVDTIII